MVLCCQPFQVTDGVAANDNPDAQVCGGSALIRVGE
jgi:hypothetical protein